MPALKNKPKIGLIDDHELIREGMEQLIKSKIENATIVFTASNGKEMIEEFEKLDSAEVPDIIITDIKMPEMNGFETVAWLKKNHPSIKIIVLSMFADRKRILRMVKLGADAYFTKDIVSDELINGINIVYKKGRYYTQAIMDIIIKAVQDDNIDTSNEKERISKVWEALPDIEKELVRLFCSEFTYAEIGKQISKSSRMIESCRVSIFEKFGVKTRVGMAIAAVKHHLIEA